MSLCGFCACPLLPLQIDVYYDNVGGFTSEAFYDCVRKFSRVAICGQISVYNDGATPKITSPFGKIIYTSVNIRGFLVFDYLGRWAEFLAAMTPLVKEGKIQYEETIVSAQLSSGVIPRRQSRQA